VTNAATPAWFEAARQEINAALQANRLSHGILIHEDPGAGGLELARWITQRVNCTEPERAVSSDGKARSGAPCGQCQGCRWIAAGQHPDVTQLSPEGDSTQILIQPVRDLSADLTLTAHTKGYKVAIISPAEAMNPFAANALLKTLEEPPKRTLVLLVTSQPSRLLPTLRSRCSKLRLVAPSRAAAASYLEAARGAGPWPEALAATGAGPFALLEADPVELAKLRSDTVKTLQDIGSGNLQPPAVAERWARGDLSTRLSCLESWVTERILESGPKRDVTLLSGEGLPLNICRLFEFSDAVRDMRRLAHTPINKTMAVEALLWRWARS
jgi:DNA polymerase III subunit delta'